MIPTHEFSFPPKIIALIIALVLIVGTVLLINKYVYGSVTIVAANSETFVVVDPADQTTVYRLPHTFRLKPGNQKISLTGTDYNGEYIPKTITVRVWPFRTIVKTVDLTKIVTTKTDHYAVRYDYGNTAFIIVPNIPTGVTKAVSTDVSTQWALYSQYAAEALKWMKSQGVDPKTVNIEWWGQDYWPKGKTITIN